MQNSEVPCIRYLIGRIVKTYDYINRVVLTLPLSVSPLSLLCITMILRVRRKILKLLRNPTNETFGNVIFSTNKTRGTWTLRQDTKEEARR